MATYTAAKVANSAPARAIEKGAVVVHSSYTASATLSAGDVVQMLNVPPGATVVSALLTTNALADQNANLQLGDGVDADRYISASGATLVSGINVASALPYEYTATDTIDVTVVNAGGTATAAAVINVAVVYHLDDATVF